MLKRWLRRWLLGTDRLFVYRCFNCGFWTFNYEQLQDHWRGNSERGCKSGQPPHRVL